MYICLVRLIWFDVIWGICKEVTYVITVSDSIYVWHRQIICICNFTPYTETNLWVEFLLIYVNEIWKLNRSHVPRLKKRRFDTTRPEIIGRHIKGSILKCLFLNKMFYISFELAKVVLNSPSNKHLSIPITFRPHWRIYVSPVQYFVCAKIQWRHHRWQDINVLCKIKLDVCPWIKFHKKLQFTSCVYVYWENYHVQFPGDIWMCDTLYLISHVITWHLHLYQPQRRMPVLYIT